MASAANRSRVGVVAIKVAPWWVPKSAATSPMAAPGIATRLTSMPDLRTESSPDSRTHIDPVVEPSATRVSPASSSTTGSAVV